MMDVETRKERYSKYREQIRHMREEEFPKAGRVAEGESASVEAVASDGGAVLSQSQPSSMLPYELYLHHRYKMLAVKIIAFALTVVGFVVWWLLMQGR